MARRSHAAASRKRRARPVDCTARLLALLRTRRPLARAMDPAWRSAVQGNVDGARAQRPELARTLSAVEEVLEHVEPHTENATRRETLPRAVCLLFPAADLLAALDSTPEGDTQARALAVAAARFALNWCFAATVWFRFDEPEARPVRRRLFELVARLEAGPGATDAVATTLAFVARHDRPGERVEAWREADVIAAAATAARTSTESAAATTSTTPAAGRFPLALAAAPAA